MEDITRTGIPCTSISTSTGIDYTGGSTQKPGTKKVMLVDVQDQEHSHPGSIEASAEIFPERSASEVALGIDLIVASIFEHLDVSTLKSCRLVCKLWRNLGGKRLQRRPPILNSLFSYQDYQSSAFKDCSRVRRVSVQWKVLGLPELTKQPPCATIKLSFGHVTDNEKRPLRDLISVVKNSDETTFPVTSFEVASRNLSSPRIQEFFSVIGHRLKKLTLTLNYRGQWMPFEWTTVMEDLRRILVTQAVHLECLELSLDLPKHWTDSLKKWNSESSGSDFEGKAPSTVLLPNLRFLFFRGALIPQRFFEEVMDGAVNLQSYHGPSAGVGNFLEYFLRENGKNRIHVLKSVTLTLDEETKESTIGTLERLLRIHGPSLQPDNFEFHNLMPSCEIRDELLPRLVSVINQVLAFGSSTIRQLELSPMGFLPGLVIPRMPSLSALLVMGQLECSHVCRHYFPPDFDLADAFPNILVISFVRGRIRKSLHNMQFLTRIPSVRIINDWSTVPCALPFDALTSILKNRFPNLETICI